MHGMPGAGCGVALSMPVNVEPIAIGRGCAVRQDGRSASLTAPSGEAQKGLNHALLSDASATPHTISSGEMHGTGTALGDPVEVGSYKGGILSYRTEQPAANLGSVKASVGHAEPGAGLVGLSKLMLMLNHAESPPITLLRVINPQVNRALGSSQAQLANQLGQQWDGMCLAKLTGSVSSFGYSGTIASVLLAAPTNGLQPILGSKVAYRRVAYPWSSTTGPHVGGEALYRYGTCWVPSLPEAVVDPVECMLLCTPYENEFSKYVQQLTSARGADSELSGCKQVILLLNNAEGAAPAMLNVQATLIAAQRLMLSAPSPSLVLLTRINSPSNGWSWGFGRVLRIEIAALKARSLAIDTRADVKAALLDSAHDETRAVGDTLNERRITPIVRVSGASMKARNEFSGAHLITGGLGGLGLRTASLAVQNGASALVLASRSGNVARDGQGLDNQLKEIQRATRLVQLRAADSSDGCDTMALLLAMKSFPEVTPQGVHHAAGVLQDKLVRSMLTSDLKWTFAPKSIAASRLHTATAFEPLSAVLFFSSAAATFGQLGQANYAAANSYMDALAETRRGVAMTATSLQLVLVLGAGMGQETLEAMAGGRGAEVAQWTLRMEQYAKAAWTAVAWPMPAGCAASVVLDATWITEAFAAMPALLQDAKTADGKQPSRECKEAAVRDAQASSLPSASKLLQINQAERQPHIEALVLKTVSELISAADVGTDTPLMEAGVDSLAATELSSSLRATTEVALSTTLLFEQPTARAIATHIVEQLCDEQAPSPVAQVRYVASADGSSVGLVGNAVVWPGGLSTKKRSIVALEDASGDAVSQAPAKRWTLEEFVDVGSLNESQLTASGFGGFVRGAQQFDPRFFNMSGSEASAMDPQQRMLLELGYVAMHNASERRTSLLASDLAIYVGFEQPDWKIAQTLMPFKELSAAYAGKGSNGSTIRMWHAAGVLADGRLHGQTAEVPIVRTRGGGGSHSDIPTGASTDESIANLLHLSDSASYVRLQKMVEAARTAIWEPVAQGELHWFHANLRAWLTRVPTAAVLWAGWSAGTAMPVQLQTERVPWSMANPSYPSGDHVTTHVSVRFLIFSSFVCL